MNNFKNIATAKATNDNKKLYEASLGRIWQHVVEADEKSIAILTSWRAANNKKQNQKQFQDLKAAVRGLGLGFVQIRGHWRECQNDSVPYENCPEEELVDAIEPSLFIIGIKQEQAEMLSNQYKQDAYIFAGPESKGKVVLLFKGGESMEIGSFKPQTLGQAYSELIKSKLASPKYFKFEGIEYTAQTWVETLIEQEVRKTLANI